MTEALSIRLDALRDRVRAEALRSERDDLARLLDDVLADRHDRLPRVVVAGQVSKGKSSLVNALLGRPGLSPVGADVTTACWIEFASGDQDEAVVLLADPDDPATPRQLKIELADIYRYSQISHVQDAVVGVQVRLVLPRPLDLVLIDMPGLGRLGTGTSAATLSALRRADALLFVCDALQPILAPEMDFLLTAADHVANIVVAIAKSDGSGHQVVTAATRATIAARPELAGIPVFAVSAQHAEHARSVSVADHPMASTLAELSGVDELRRALTAGAALRDETLRLANAALLIRAVARGLADWVSQRIADATSSPRPPSNADDVADLVRGEFAARDVNPRAPFDGRALSLREFYRLEAERGPAAQLTTLAPRLTADLTAAATDTLEWATEQVRQLVSDLLHRLGATGLAVDIPAVGGNPVSLPTPDLPHVDPIDGVVRAAQLFPKLAIVIGGSTMVAAVLSGPALLAAGIIVAACAGWWRIRGDTEQQRRAFLRSWVDSAVAAAREAFSRVADQRVAATARYAEAVVTDLLATRDSRLADAPPTTDPAALRRTMRVLHDVIDASTDIITTCTAPRRQPR